MLKNIMQAEKSYSLDPNFDPSEGIFYKNFICVKSYQFQTFEEARKTAFVLSKFYPNPTRAETGLNELFMNAIEHGNLNISFEEKSKFVNKNEWMNNVYQRLFLPENKKKKVHVRFEKRPDSIIVQIKDEGNGFNWQSYFDQYDKMKYHGRGIMIAKQFAFDAVEYLGNGNHVVCSVYNKSI